VLEQLERHARALDAGLQVMATLAGEYEVILVHAPTASCRRRAALTRLSLQVMSRKNGRREQAVRAAAAIRLRLLQRRHSQGIRRQGGAQAAINLSGGRPRPAP